MDIKVTLADLEGGTSPVVLCDLIDNVSLLSSAMDGLYSPPPHRNSNLALNDFPFPFTIKTPLFHFPKDGCHVTPEFLVSGL